MTGYIRLVWPSCGPGGRCPARRPRRPLLGQHALPACPVTFLDRRRKPPTLLLGADGPPTRRRARQRLAGRQQRRGGMPYGPAAPAGWLLTSRCLFASSATPPACYAWRGRRFAPHKRPAVRSRSVAPDGGPGRSHVRAVGIMVSCRAAAAYASLSFFVVMVRVLIERGVLTKGEATEVLEEAEAMLAHNGGASSNADAIELLRTDIRERIGLA
jgi:hypothetical protein